MVQSGGTRAIEIAQALICVTQAHHVIGFTTERGVTLSLLRRCVDMTPAGKPFEIIWRGFQSGKEDPIMTLSLKRPFVKRGVRGEGGCSLPYGPPYFYVIFCVGFFVIVVYLVRVVCPQHPTYRPLWLLSTHLVQFQPATLHQRFCV